MVVDDQLLMRGALEHFVSSAEDLELVGAAADGVEAVAKTEELDPGVVLMDLQMPQMDGVAATRVITERWPDVRVLAITTFSSEHYLIPALQAGVQGYIAKDSRPEDVIEGIRKVSSGDAVFSPRIMHELIATVRRHQAPRVIELGESERLTPRELHVVRELADGKSNAEIGAALFLAEATVKSHLGRILEKWRVRDRVQVLVKAAEAGIVRIGS
ncbi:MAG: response regulator [Citricoccus sp.]